MIRLIQHDHEYKDKGNMIEIWDNDRFVGAIYPDINHMKIITKHNILHTELKKDGLGLHELRIRIEHD